MHKTLLSSRKGNVGGRMAALFGGLILIVVTLALVPTVRGAVGNATANQTGADVGIYNLIPLFWAFIGLAVGVGLVIYALKFSK